MACMPSLHSGKQRIRAAEDWLFPNRGTASASVRSLLTSSPFALRTTVQDFLGPFIYNTLDDRLTADGGFFCVVRRMPLLR